ncbi:sterol desaturase family protein [Limibacter armeniacum]|uniref:sterol desaturase family protein n=1 Tax=Limibacter armeniacum TaxID=466084 RepID=UPI002FE50204
METYAKTLLYAIPGFVVLMLIEVVYGYVKKYQTFKGMDTVSSLSSGFTNILKSTLGLTVVIISYEWIVGRVALIEVESSWLVYLLGFIFIDLAGYLWHRVNHKVNYFWNVHLIHHSSEEFNLACALRQTISNVFGYYALFLLPAALLGIPPKVIAIISPLHLFLQFWYHTRHIGKMGFLEYIIVTPSQHRVHHAINPVYLDKNFGQIFSIWDRMFGSFQEELDDEPCVYGITRPVSTWNPIKINFQHFWLLIKDAWRAKSYWDKLRIWFMPTGWRPEDVNEKYPVHYIQNPHDFEKYGIKLSNGLIAWTWFQFVVCFVLLLHMFAHFGAIGFPNLLYYGAFLFVAVYGYTSMMDKTWDGFLAQMLYGIGGVAFIVINGDWFGINDLFPQADFVLLSYFALTGIGALYFSLTELKQDKQPTKKLAV